MIDLILTDFNAGKIHLKISIGLLKVVINSSQIVLDEITYAFRGRTGYFPEEIIAFKDKILNQIGVDLHDSNTNLSSEIVVVFSFEDIMMINGCLNEICNGLKIDEFENRVGYSKDLVKTLLSEVNPIARKISEKVEQVL
jgi:hypothetical protein